MKRSQFFKSFLTLLAAPTVIGEIEEEQKCLFDAERISQFQDEPPKWAKIEYGDIHTLKVRDRKLSFGWRSTFTQKDGKWNEVVTFKNKGNA